MSYYKTDSRQRHRLRQQRRIKKQYNIKLSIDSKKLFMGDKLHLISYGDRKYVKAKQRIYNEAMNTGWFYSINCYGKQDLSINFRNEFRYILSLNRGGGYWIWKFDIILRKLKEINTGEYLIYLDSGCSINSNGSERLEEYINMIKNNEHKIISFQGGSERLEEYINMIKNNEHKIISFQGGSEKNWTTKQIFDAFSVLENDPIETSGQYIGGILIMQKCNAVINIFKDCLHKIRQNHLIITDYYNKNQRDFFKDNRHDQSILSVARKKHGSIVIPDETYSLDFNSKSMRKIPFLATRKN